MNYPLIDSFAWQSILTGLVTFLPKLIVALIILFLGKILAKSLSAIITKIMPAAGLVKFVNSFQLGVKMENDFATGLVQAVGLVVRYVVVYISLIFALQVVGLMGIANFLSGLVTILPKVLSALIILFIGVIIAGFVESLIKKALITLDPATARLGGKIASYTVVSFFALMGLAELGLAATFINTLFIGLVAAVSLAFGLAIGLGAKDLVKDILGSWYERRVIKVPKKSNK